jgi:glycosyltransferase involved in cell wall biosynthesis
MISLVIPAIDNHAFMERALSYAVNNATEELDIIIVDNASYRPYALEDYPDVSTIIKVEVNLGVPQSIKKAAAVAKSDVIVFIHDDVYIHEAGWDVRIRKEFDEKSKLGMAGFFGAHTVSDNGGRIGSMSNMLGLVGGTSGDIHGLPLYETYPAAVLDGMCMIFRKSVLDELDFSKLPPHHWYDRIIPLMCIDKGYWVETIGIGFDHATGGTAGRKQYHESALVWLEKHGYPTNEENVDGMIYGAGLDIFTKEWANRLPLIVDDNFHYYWNR